MSAKSIREYHGKKLASRWLSHYSNTVKYDLEDRAILISPANVNVDNLASFDAIAAENPWCFVFIANFFHLISFIFRLKQGTNYTSSCQAGSTNQTKRESWTSGN